MKQKLEILFVQKYGLKPEYYLQCGGRFEVLGNHTDHNNGLCIAGTCSLTTNAAVSKRKDTKIIVYSEGYQSFEIDVSDLQIKPEEKETTQGIIRGIAAYFEKNGLKYGGLNICCTSNIPRGAGVSSSAAFELLIAQIFNQLFNEGKIEKLDLCKAGHFAEREYFGKKCGLLDQIGVGYGGYTFINFSKGNNPEVESLNLDMTGYSFLSVNTGGSHADLSDMYSAIPDDMHNAANKLGCKNLIETNIESVEANKDKLTEIEYTRCLHFFGENERVRNAKTAILNKDVKSLIKLMNESCYSSTNLLKNMYVNNIEGSPLEACQLIQKASNNTAGVKINGGGFAGSVIALVPDNVLDQVKQASIERYGIDNVHPLNIRDVGPDFIK